MKPEIPLFQRLGTELIGSSKEPLSPTVKRGVLALVIFFHVGGGWALTQVEPVKLIVGDIAPMEVRMVPAEQPAEPEIENAEPPPPVEIKQPDLAAIVDPPPDDLPPPEFPLAKVDIPPPQEPPPPIIPPLEKPPDPKPEQPKPVQKKPPAPGRRRRSTTSRSRRRRARPVRRAPCRPRSSATSCRPTRSIRRARARPASRAR